MKQHLLTPLQHILDKEIKKKIFYLPNRKNNTFKPIFVCNTKYQKINEQQLKILKTG